MPGVHVVTGDTKVVERGRADGVYITTAGVGVFDGGWQVPLQKPVPGDSILVTGPIASHGMAVMAAREDMGFFAADRKRCTAADGLAAHCTIGGRVGTRNARPDPGRFGGNSLRMGGGRTRYYP